jgi:hypothetical protein
LPTAFRSAPINYAGTYKIENNPIECQFFGVAGYEEESLVSGAVSDGFTISHPELEVPTDLSLSIRK